MEKLTKEEMISIGNCLAPILEKRASVSGAFVEAAEAMVSAFIEQKILPQVPPPSE